MQVRAAVLEEFGKPLVVQQVELAEPKAGEALVRLVACGVCHTDLYTASGADPSGYAPAVLGHEGAGVVERIGEGVTSLAPGVPRLVERWLADDLDVEPFVSHKLTLDEVNRGFELMEAQDGIRSVIDFS